MRWYLQSLSNRDTHRGYLRRGRVLAVCGVEFSPLRAWRKDGPALLGEPPDPEERAVAAERAEDDPPAWGDRAGVAGGAAYRLGGLVHGEVVDGEPAREGGCAGLGLITAW